MIESLLHFLGICPDSLSHINLISIINFPIVEINYWATTIINRFR